MIWIEPAALQAVWIQIVCQDALQWLQAWLHCQVHGCMAHLATRTSIVPLLGSQGLACQML